MRDRNEVLDDDGNVIPPPDGNSPVAQIVWLLEYGRKRGFKIGPHVQVGDTIVEVSDLRQSAAREQANSPIDLVPGSDMHTLMLGDK